MVSPCYCVMYTIRLQFKILWQGYIKKNKNLRFHRRVYRRTITRRYFTESRKTFTGLCHFHRRIHQRTLTRRYFTESYKKITGLCHNHRRVPRRLYRRTIPTESLMDLRTSRSARMFDTCPSAQIPTDRKVWRDFRTFFVRISINFRRYYRRNLMPPTTINFRR